MTSSFGSSRSTEGQPARRHGDCRTTLSAKNELFRNRLLINRNGRKQLFLLSCVILGLIVASSSIQSGNSAKFEKNSERDGHPCICNGKFYMSCPRAGECQENRKRSSKVTDDDDVESMPFDLDAGPMNLPDFQHDDSHPDHVDIEPFFQSASGGIINDPILKLPGARLPPLSGERILRHRKVYVSKDENKMPIIKPISITVPLKVPEYDMSLPEPKPVYKYKKYRTYESKPEIQMVPVTKTIIRPADVTLDQIVDENGKKVPKDFDVKKL